MVFEGEAKPITAKGQGSVKNEINAILFRSAKLIKAIKLNQRKFFTINWSTTKCVTENCQDAHVRGLMLHHDNWPPHLARFTVNFLEQNRIKVIEYLPNFYDLATYGFWLLCNKNTLTSFALQRWDLLMLRIILFIDYKKCMCWCI